VKVKGRRRTPEPAAGMRAEKDAMGLVRGKEPPRICRFRPPKRVGMRALGAQRRGARQELARALYSIV
jgi:hypothetical protein